MHPGGHLSAAATDAAAIPILAYLISFSVAAFLAGFNLVMDKFPRQFFLVYACVSFYLYCLLYGAVAVFLL